MKKDRNKVAFPAKGKGLPKTDILRGRDNFKRLFEGSVTVFSQHHISLRYYTFAEGYECKMGFIVAKRLGSAVERNYIKRILREAYRLNREPLTSTLAAVSGGFHGAFLAKTTQMDFYAAEKELINLLDRAVNDLHSTFDL